MKITVPDKYTGDVMGDLNKRRGRVLGMNPDHKGNQIIEADIPTMELYGYSTTPVSYTHLDVYKRQGGTVRIKACQKNGRFYLG